MTSTEYIKAALADGVSYAPAKDWEHARALQKNICGQARYMLVQVKTCVSDVIHDHTHSVAVRIEIVPDA